jgi:type 1 fimbria pilin
MLRIIKALTLIAVPCYIMHPHFALACSYVNSGYTVNVGTVVVQRDVPINSYVTTQKKGPDQKAWDNCTGSLSHGSYGQFNIFSSLTPDGKIDSRSIFKTTLAGTGLAIGGSGSFVSGGNGCSYSYAPDDNYIKDDTTIALCQNSAGLYDLPMWAQPYVRVVKTGNMEGGSLSGKIAYLAESKHNSAMPEIPVYISGSIVVIKCAITTPTMTFPIGNVPASDFGTKVGFIPTKTSTQNLGLDCDADANINVQLSGTQNPDVSTKSVLALNGQGDAGTASGVGVQLLYNGTPLEINKNIVMKKSSGGQEMLPITARYYQTKTAVTTGDASTSATLALTYQ